MTNMNAHIRCMDRNVNIRMNTYAHANVYDHAKNVCISSCMYNIYIYIIIHRHTHKHAHRHRQMNPHTINISIHTVIAYIKRQHDIYMHAHNHIKIGRYRQFHQKGDTYFNFRKLIKKYQII